MLGEQKGGDFIPSSLFIGPLKTKSAAETVKNS